MNIKLPLTAQIDTTAILAAIEHLQTTYPNERVELWIQAHAKGQVEFMSKVGDEYGLDYPKGLKNVYGHGVTPMDAANDVISKAGERSLAAVRKSEIEKLRKQLAELEAQTVQLLNNEASAPAPSANVTPAAALN